MNTIHKYEIPLTGTTVLIPMPEGAEIIRFAPQGSQMTLYVWALVNTTAAARPRELVIVGTGQQIPAASRHVASCEAGPYIWHLFEGKR